LVEPLQDLPTWSATRRVISGDAAQPIEQAELGVDAEVDEVTVGHRVSHDVGPSKMLMVDRIPGQRTRGCHLTKDWW